MRLFVIALVPSLCAAATAFAEPGVAAVDDEPTSRLAATARPADGARGRKADDAHRGERGAVVERSGAVDRRLPADVGQLREARVAAPDPVAVTAEPASTREHAVAAPAATGASSASDGELSAELAARQMRRHARAFDPCKAAALKRAPSATGRLVLALEIADRKVQSVQVSDDGVHDPAFTACVTTAARRLPFALASARFGWEITIR